MTKWYDISIIKKLRQKYNVSFNSSAIGIFLKSEYKLLKNVKGLNIVIPCGYTPLPENIEQVQLKNLAHGFMLHLPLINNYNNNNNLYNIHKTIKNHLFNTSVTFMPIFLFRIISEIFPLFILNFIGNNILLKTDMLISNVPGPEMKCNVCGCELTDIYPVVSSGRLKCFVTITSFNKMFRYVISFDKSVSYDLDELINEIENNIEMIKNEVLE